jgi:hypothetical protein
LPDYFQISQLAWHRHHRRRGRQSCLALLGGHFLAHHVPAKIQFRADAILRRCQVRETAQK